MGLKIIGINPVILYADPDGEFFIEHEKNMFVKPFIYTDRVTVYTGGYDINSRRPCIAGEYFDGKECVRMPENIHRKLMESDLPEDLKKALGL